MGILVSDNGVVIPHSVRDRVFEPFFSTKPTGSGTGLGLSLAYDIVTKGHAGRLRVDSEEGQGAAFIVELPRDCGEATQKRRKFPTLGLPPLLDDQRGGLP